MHTKLITLFFFFLTVTTQATWASQPKTPQGGLQLIDPIRKLEVTAPNDNWGIHAGKFTISLNHTTHYDTNVTLKKSWYTAKTAKEAYQKRAKNLKSYLPNAEMITENQSLDLSTRPALSMTYKNPKDNKIVREIVFVHQGLAFELVFEAKEENFQTVKEDFGFILHNLRFQD